MPPDNEVGPRGNPEGTDNTITTPAPNKGQHSQCNDASRQCEHPARQLSRRRMASYRCEPLPSGHRDTFQPWRPEVLSDKQIEAAGIAARHLLHVGVVPRFDVVTLRQLWRRGDRAIAELLHDLTGGEVA
jgi:hypothetical protein